MPMLRQFASRISALFKTRRLENDLDDEVRAHIELLTEENVRHGMPATVARYAALREFGGVDQAKEVYREQRGLPMVETLMQDIRYGLRMLAKSPGFTAIAVLTLALGIGANTAIFTLTYAVILRSLPVPSPGQLVRYTFRNGAQDIGLSGPAYDALRKQETVLTGLLAWSDAELAVEENGAVTRVNGAMLTGNGFRVLELRPFLGRFFGAADDVSGGGPNGYQALLGYNYWKDHFQGSPNIVGRPLTINGRSVTVLGVLPAGFEGLIAGERADIVLPLAFEEVINAPHPNRNHAGSFWLTVMGRLKATESVGTAEANLHATETAVREAADPRHIYLSGFFAPFHFGVESGRAGRSYMKVIYAQPLLVLAILVGLLLLLCCANTALLVLARLSSRSREFAVRSALGAPRRRLFRQVLSEVGLLAACGLGGGVYLGWVAAQAMVAMLPAVGERPPIDVAPRAAILAFTAAISVLSALAAGLWPAWRASRVAPMLGLKQGDALSPSKRLGSWIVPAQVAVSVTLLAAATLLGGTFVRLLLEDSGFRSDGLVLADVDLRANKLTDAQATQTAQQLVEALENIPGVEAATAMTLPPLENAWSAGHYFSLGERGTVHSDMQTWGESISPGYFRAMGTRIVEGREPARGDVGGDRVCVLGSSAAAYFFPGVDPVGRFIYAGGGDPSKDGNSTVKQEDTWRVIGVAEDARFRSLRESPPRMLYQLARPGDLTTQFSLAVRSKSTASSAAAIREAFQRVAPTAVEPRIYTFNELVRAHLRTERMLMSLSLCFAAIALLLTGLGLYGLLARSVVLRTKEIGLRLALGASPRDALAQVIGQGLRLVLVGIGLGILGALGLTRLARGLLFRVQATDPLVLAIVVVALLGVALLACYLPARRAMRVDMMTALRYE
jgi:predicted permease